MITKVIIANTNGYVGERCMGLLMSLKPIDIYLVLDYAKLDQTLSTIKPEMLVLNLSFIKSFDPSSFQEFVSRYKNIRVVLISEYSGNILYSRLIKLGVCAVFEVDELVRDGEFEKGIRCVVDNGSYIVNTKYNCMHFTNQELKIIRLLLDGIGNKEIADYLNIDTKTIHKHIRKIILKTGSRNLIHFVIEAQKQGFKYL